MYINLYMDIRDYNATGIYTHEVNGHEVRVKWTAKKEIDDKRERPYIYEATFSLGYGKDLKTMKIRESDPEVVHRKTEQKIEQFYESSPKQS